MDRFRTSWWRWRRFRPGETSPRPRASLQVGAVDCGPANLRALCLTHGLSLANERLRELCQTSGAGTSLAGLCQAARALGFDAWLHALDLHDLRDHADLYLPAIVALDTEGPLLHFVTIHGFHGDDVLVMDPVVGLHVVRFADLRERIHRTRTTFPRETLNAERQSGENIQEIRSRLLAAGVAPDRVAEWLRRHDLFFLDDALKYASIIRGTRDGEALGPPHAVLRHLVETRLFDLPPSYRTLATHHAEGPDTTVQGPVVLVVRGSPTRAASPRRTASPRRRLVSLILGHHRVWRGLLLLSLLGSAAGLLMPLVAGWTINALETGWPPLLPVLLGGMLFQAQSRHLAFAGQRLGRRTRRAVSLRLQSGLLQAWQQQSPERFDDRLPGELLQRYDEAAGLTSLLVDWPPAVAGALLSFAGAMVMLATGYPWFLAVAASQAAVAWALGEAFAVRLRRLSRDSLEQSSRYSARFLECLRGLEELYLNQCTETVALEAQAVARDQTAAQLRVQDWSISHQLARGAVNMLAALVMMVLAYAKLRSGQVAPGGIVAALAYGGTASGAFGALVSLRQRLERASLVMERYEELAPAGTTRCTIGDGGPCGSAAPVTASWRRLTVREVAFRHHGGRRVLTDVSLEIPRGRVICLLGASGAGKSTLLDLLAGERVPDEGTVSLDGRPLAPARAVAEGILLVEQEPALIRGTIADNVRMGWGEAPETLFREVARITHLEGIVARHPLGWERPIGGRTGGISGGERRRVAIARALLRRPALLLLDESLGSLDWPLRRDILAGLRRFDPSLAILLTTHDPSDAFLCDEVLILAEGRIIEHGRVSALADRDSLFRSWLRGGECVA